MLNIRSLCAELLELSPHRSESMVREGVSCIINIMTKSLQRHEYIDIRGFGRFSIRESQPRTVLHPITKVPYTVPVRKKVYFRAGQLLKKQIDGFVI